MLKNDSFFKIMHQIIPNRYKNVGKSSNRLLLVIGMQGRMYPCNLTVQYPIVTKLETP